MMKEMIKKYLQLGGLMVALALSPIIMDHARDIYLAEVVSKKAHPVKLLNGRVIGSSWQVKYKGRRLTVTNHHVCKVVERFSKQQMVKKVMEVVVQAISKGATLQEIENISKVLRSQIFKKKFPLIGEQLIIGDSKKKILYMSKVHDICFLESEGERYFSLASSVNRGESVSIIGHPRGIEEQSISDGRIVGERHSMFPWIQKAGIVRVLLSTAISYPGNSGSPVVNRYGNVVGILFAGTGIGHLNVNLIVPLEYIEQELEAFVTKE